MPSKNDSQLFVQMKDDMSVAVFAVEVAEDFFLLPPGAPLPVYGLPVVRSQLLSSRWPANISLTEAVLCQLSLSGGTLFSSASRPARLSTMYVCLLLLPNPRPDTFGRRPVARPWRFAIYLQPEHV